jgi:uncharacterized protein
VPDIADIPEPMRRQIGAQLEAIERQEGVTISLAVESGSRAWGFPSLDSDYDVRFVYRRPLAAYISVGEPRDVIERPIDEALDVSGWDLRKALQLLVRSNAVLIEWLASPIRYCEKAAETARLGDLARETACLPALAYHYDRSARRSWTEIQDSADGVRLKTYCYALRPTLALRWIRGRGEPPPMDLPRLLEGPVVSADIRDAVALLLRQKRTASEKAATPRIGILDEFIAGELAETMQRPHLPDRAAALARADALFASLLGLSTLTSPSP